MYEIDFNKPLHIHFIGIGGISMSGLAEILLKEDFKISGSDASQNLKKNRKIQRAILHLWVFTYSAGQC